MSLFFSTATFLFKKYTKIHTIYSKFTNLIKIIYKKFLFENQIKRNYSKKRKRDYLLSNFVRFSQFVIKLK